MLLSLLVAHIALKIVLFPIAADTPITGDEGFYNKAARSMAAAARSIFTADPIPVAELRANVIGHGWFMPGVSLVLTPLYVLVPDPSLIAVRVYTGTVSTALLLLGAWLIARSAGAAYCGALLVFPGLVPLWVLFSYTSWGDLLAGLMLVVVLAELVRQWGVLGDVGGVRLTGGLLLGSLLAITLYLRSSVLPLVLVVLALTLVAVLARSQRRLLLRSVLAWILAVVVFLVLLLPWSYAASRAFGSRVTTTTTVPISMAYAFGNRDELCLGPCRDGNPWYAMVEYSERVAQRTGESELQVQRRMADYALRDVTPRSYASDVLSGFGRYVMQPTGYEFIFRVPAGTKDFRPNPPNAASFLIVWLTSLLYFPTLLLAALGIVIVRRVAPTAQLVALLAAVLGGSLMSQPFVHVASPRYWPVFAPLMALSAVGLLVSPDPTGYNVWLQRLRVIAAVGWVLVIGGLVAIATR